MIADNSPCCSTICGLGELVIEPVFLAPTHKRASSIVGYLLDECVVVVHGGDGTIVVTGIEHDEVKEFAHGEAPPDSEIVIQIYLTDGHPFKIGSYRVHLALVDAYSASFLE